MRFIKLYIVLLAKYLYYSQYRQLRNFIRKKIYFSLTILVIVFLIISKVLHTFKKMSANFDVMQHNNKYYNK